MKSAQNPLKVQSLSDNLSLITCKYFLSILFITIGILLMLKPISFLTLFAILFIGLGVFYLMLKRINFDDEFVYVGRKKYRFDQLTKLSALEVNLYVFPYIELNDNGKKRRIITDTGQAGILRVLMGILIPSLDPLKNIKRFTTRFEMSRQVKLNKNKL